MSQSLKDERSLATQDEFELLSRTHFPALLELDDEALSEARRRMREMRAKERTFVHDMRRSIRGKAEPRGASFPGNVERPSRRKQLFAGALRRINGEIRRRHTIAAQTELIASAHRALSLKTAAHGRRNAHPASRTSRAGMTPLESRRYRYRVHPSKVGRVSQATKVAQAARDARAG